jgi:signal transduction histidine kinase
VTIADTGTGISPEHKPQLFEAFYTTKKSVGTGLGLWLSKEIVEKHGGSISVRSSVRWGRSGSVFSVFLPAGPNAKRIEPAPQGGEMTSHVQTSRPKTA